LTKIDGKIRQKKKPTPLEHFKIPDLQLKGVSRQYDTFIGSYQTKIRNMDPELNDIDEKIVNFEVVKRADKDKLLEL
jgi:acetoacetate decarboxylase